MNYIVSLLLVFSSLGAFGQTEIAPADVVDAQLRAYNSKDLDAFLDTYSDYIEVYEFGKDVPMISGKERLRENYNTMFEGSAILDASVTNRIVHGNKVIDYEIAKGIYDGDPVEVVVIYEVNNGLIDRVTFVY